MPELPEVESARLFLLQHCPPGTLITAVLSAEQGDGPRHGTFDDIVIDCSAVEIEEALVNKVITGIERKGKQLWFTLAKSAAKTNRKQVQSAAVLFHFGMTGSFAMKGKPLPRYQNFKISESSWPPKFTKLELLLSNGERLAFCDPRRLGRVRVRDDPLNTAPIVNLARDPVIDGLSAEDITSALTSPRVVTAPIKAALLDQEKICCGIGNWVADEVLYQSKIHPNTASNLLTQQEIAILADSINIVLSTAVQAGADSALFPKDWIFHKRWRSSGNKKGINLPIIQNM